MTEHLRALAKSVLINPVLAQKAPIGASLPA